MKVCKAQAIELLQIKRDCYLASSLGRDDIVRCPSLTNTQSIEQLHQFRILYTAILNHRYVTTHVVRINVIDMIDLLSRQMIKLNSTNP